ncbi:MAG: hypothetical protein AAGC71_08525 [Pseudomonadota bacterium]
MPNTNHTETVEPVLTEESSQARWSWVHRAISSAKSSNARALYDAEALESIAPATRSKD